MKMIIEGKKREPEMHHRKVDIFLTKFPSQPYLSQALLSVYKMRIKYSLVTKSTAQAVSTRKYLYISALINRPLTGQVTFPYKLFMVRT